MDAKKIIERNNTLDKRFSSTQQSSQWKSILSIDSKKKQVCLDEIVCHLRKYLSDHWSTIDQQLKMKGFIDKQTFEQILRYAGLVLDNESLEVLWDSCQPSENVVSYEVFRQRFAPLELDSNQNFQDKILPDNHCQILNYITRVSSTVKQNWQNLKEDFCSFDRYGRLTITINEAIKLMQNYCFPLNEKEQRELATLFSPQKNGQFHYYEFLQHFTNQSNIQTQDQGEVFSPLTYTFSTKQPWTSSPVTINDIFNRIRSECMKKYGNIFRMFQKLDKNRQRYLTRLEFNRLLHQFNIHLSEDEFYFLICEIDKNQHGIITLNELYSSLIMNTLQI